MEPGKLASNSSRLLTNDPVVFGTSELLKIDVDSVPEYPIFLPYQKAWLLDKNPIAITEKSRQIGWSFIHAFRAVYKAVNNERDTIVTTYNKSAIKQFIKDCTFWAKLFNTVFKITDNRDVVKDRFINVFELRFINNRMITGLPGDAVNLRSYSGRDIVIDEAAYRSQPLEDILAAGMAAIIHGGSIRIGSTHAGTDSDFAKLCDEVRKGNKPFSLHKTTFKEAINEGLYKRICVKKKEQWSIQKEIIWTEGIYTNYGIRASEELDVIPGDFGDEGKLFGKIQTVKEDFSRYWEWSYYRYHDLAATDEKDDVNNTAFYSASIKFAVHNQTNEIIMVDYYAYQLDAKDGDTMILETAVSDGNNTCQILEKEPGSTGKKWYDYISEMLVLKDIFNVVAYEPKLKKLHRLIPVANAVQRGKVKRLDNEEMKTLQNILIKCSAKKKPLVSDLADCCSGGFDYIVNERNLYL